MLHTSREAANLNCLCRELLIEWLSVAREVIHRAHSEMSCMNGRLMTSYGNVKESIEFSVTMLDINDFDFLPIFS